MKMKRALYLLVFLFAPFTLSAAHWYVEAKPGFYYFTDRSVREILGTGTFSIKAEAGCQFYGPLAIWLDGGYFSKEGNAVGGSGKCGLKMGNITMGAKAILFYNPKFAFYAGLGPRIFFIHIHNCSPFVEHHQNSTEIGGAFQAGFWILPIRHLFIDLFLDYSYIKFTPPKNGVSTFVYQTDLSGLAYGLGIGVRF
jgi:hypothetical protein